MSWDENARNNYFNSINIDQFLTVFYKADSVERLVNRYPKFPFALLKELICRLTKELPTGHFAGPIWSQSFSRTERRLLLVIGRADMGYRLRNDHGQRVGVFYGKRLDAPKEDDKLYIFAFGHEENMFIKDFPHEWKPITDYFRLNQISGLQNKCKVYDKPYTGDELEDSLSGFLRNIPATYNDQDNTIDLLTIFNNYQGENNQQGGNVVNIPENNVITPLILTTLLDG